MFSFKKEERQLYKYMYSLRSHKYASFIAWQMAIDAYANIRNVIIFF